MKVFLDSDVVIAGLISSKGAGNYLLTNILKIEKIAIFSTKKQVREIKKAINHPDFSRTIDQKLWKKFQNGTTRACLSDKLKNQALAYVADIKDCHILSGSIASNAEFLLTYNIKHYRKELIKRDLKIKVEGPGFFLQFLRTKGLIKSNI